MKKFEYKMVSYPNVQELNELGLEGWELVSINYQSGMHAMKREITPDGAMQLLTEESFNLPDSLPDSWADE